MALKELSLATLQEAHNRAIAIAFDEELQRVIEDLKNRPNEKKARSLNLQISFTPVADDNDATLLDATNITFQVSSSVPKRKSSAITLVPRGNGLVFSDNTRDARHRTLDKMFDEPGLPEGINQEDTNA